MNLTPNQDVDSVDLKLFKGESAPPLLSKQVTMKQFMYILEIYLGLQHQAVLSSLL